MLAKARDFYVRIASQRIKPQSTMAQQVAQAVMAFQQKTTGHAPNAQVLFFVFLVIFFVSLVGGLARRNRRA